MVKWFEPYFMGLGHIRIGRLFFVGTQQARDWYDPIPKPLELELCWILDNCNLGKDAVFLDGGAHHGLHSIIVGGECKVIAVDIHAPHQVIQHVNAELNQVPIYMALAALAHDNGTVFYDGEALGSLSKEGIPVPCVRVQTLCPDVTVVKLDIEGGEFYVVPDCIDVLEHVEAWIVEIHPFELNEDGKGNPWELANMFVDRGYNVSWIDRAKGEEATIEPYYDGVPWAMMSTILCKKGE